MTTTTPAPRPPPRPRPPPPCSPRPRRPRRRSTRRPAAGGGDAAAQALLKNKNLVLDADAQADIGNGEVDPRMIALLDQLTEKHKIELSVIKTGHDQFTSGGSVSNHFVGRGIDIARVDGEIVNPGSPAARELATEIAEMTGDLRPTEVGTPWAIGAPGFFTDGAHQDHLHVAFDGEPPRRLPGAGAGRPRRRRGRRRLPASPWRGRRRAARPSRATRWQLHGRQGRGRRGAEEGRLGAFMAGRRAAAPAPAAAPAAVPGAAARRRRRGRPLGRLGDAYPGDDATQGGARRLDGQAGPGRAGCRPSCRSWPRSSSPG